MVLRSVPDCLDSDIWSQNDMQDSVFKPSEEMLRPCSRPGLMDRRQKPNTDQVALKCPRCDSSNTKFCYYNNYSLSQPRYFCKTCRRYWTNGGSLRNVPVGGGCRKNKRTKRTGDQPVNCAVQNNIEPTTSTSATNSNNEYNRCSPNLDQTSLPALPSVYFSLLNEGVDGLGVPYASRSLHQQQALRVTDQSLLRGNCNSSTGLLEISATSSQPTSLLPPLPNLPNLTSLLKSANLITGLESPRISCGRADQGASMAVHGDLSSIFEAQVAAATSSATAISQIRDGFNDSFGLAVHDNRLNSESQIHDNDIQWQMQQQLDQQKLVIPVDNHGTGQMMLPYVHENNGAEELGHHHDLKLRQLFMTSIPSKLYEENRPGACNWQLPALSEGLLDTSGNNIGYWNGGGLADLSSYASYTNPLI